ncbi:g043 [Yersinia phage phiR1-37]|uniref:hypothetical protein n=1 Tax=Yersinia phage phiR1-37 TaxID=331278 RepID=UPI00022DBCD7|nr:hypothetical protein phiR1-37_gp043 [Yersinia phage phiR1-37]CCE26067.1 g043 [Yersinia phage phiR1-37]
MKIIKVSKIKALTEMHRDRYRSSGYEKRTIFTYFLDEATIGLREHLSNIDRLELTCRSKKIFSPFYDKYIGTENFRVVFIEGN